VETDAVVNQPDVVFFIDQDVATFTISVINQYIK
jgi:hypothetical protein